MPVIFEYIIKQSISLGIIYLFYWLVLRRLTFYIRNRWYLLGYSIFSFLIPFINISPFLQKNEWTDNKLLGMISLFENYGPANVGIDAAEASREWSNWDWLIFLLLAGIVMMLARLVIQIFSFQKMKKTSCLISDNKVRVYQVNQSIIPFSFGRSIFINRQLHNEDELKKVICHEFVHVRQRHTIDIIWSEMLCILNWFNPFAWLIRNAIRQNLEFIADNKVLDEGIDKKQYQYLLLKVVGNNHFSIAHQFNFSSLKKRIAMMNKMKTARVQLVKFLFVLPVIAVLLLAFRERFVNKTDAIPLPDSGKPTELYTHKNGNNYVMVDTIPEPLKIKEGKFLKLVSYSLHKTDEMTKEQHAFFERNPKVILLHWKKGRIVEVYLSDGAVEEYDLENDRKEIERKYGKLPPSGGSMTRVYSPDEVAAIATSPIPETDVITVSGMPIARAAPSSVNAIGAGNTISTTTATSLSPITVIGVDMAGLSTATAPRSSVNATGLDNATGLTIADGVAALASTAPISSIDALESAEKFMELKIYKNSKKEDLDRLVAEAKLKGVTLEFDDIDFTDGHLVSISGTMKKDDSKSNFTATDFAILRLTMYKQGEHYSLRVSVSRKQVI